jgi:membrane protein DedA with SNARE-associated domain
VITASRVPRRPRAASTGDSRRRAAAGLLALGAAVMATLIASSALPQVGEAVQDSGRSLGAWVWPLAAAMAFFETSIPPVTLVFPGEWVIFYIGALAGEGELPVVALLLLVWVCSVTGDTVTFLLGRRFGRRFFLRRGARLGLTEQRLAGVENWFERYGPAAVALGRIVPFVRPTAPFVAGSAGFPLRRFLPWDLLGTALFSLVFCLLGYLSYRSRDQVEAALGLGGVVLFLALAVVAVIVVLVRRRRARVSWPVGEAGADAPPRQPDRGRRGPARAPGSRVRRSCHQADRGLRILLSEGSSLTARQVALLAGAAGHEVHLASSDPLCLARWSRHVRGVHRVPAYGGDPFAWLEVMLRILRDGFDVLLPTHEQVAVLARESHRVQAAGVATALPPFSELCRVQDKLSAYATLAEIGLAQPPSTVAHSGEELLAAERLPLFIKRAIGTASAGIHYVSDRATLARIAEELDVAEAFADGGLLVQQPVGGPLVMVQAVYAGSELTAWHANMRVREGARGSASGKGSIRPPTIEFDLVRLGAALNWHGALSLDAVLTDEGPRYIDVNPRPVEPGNAWRSGVDLVEALLCVALGQPAPATSARPQVNTHQLIPALLALGERGSRRRAILGELSTAARRGGPYRGSSEELTPLRRDLQAAIPTAAISAALLVSPRLWRALASSAVENYALTPQAWRAIRWTRRPDPASSTREEQLP